MAEATDFNGVILQLQKNNADEKARDSNLNKNIAHLRTSLIDAVGSPTPAGKTPLSKAEEDEKNKNAKQTKLTKLWTKMSKGIGSLVESNKKMFTALTGGSGTLGKMIRGTLFAGLLIAVANWLNSPSFGKTVDYLTNTLGPMIDNLWNNVIKPVGNWFINHFKVAFDGLLKFSEDPSWSSFFEMMGEGRWQSILITFTTLGLIFAPRATIWLALKALKVAWALAKGALSLLGVDLTDMFSKKKLKNLLPKKGWLKNGMTRLKDGVKGLFSKDGLKNTLKGTKGMVGNLMSGLKNRITGLFGTTMDAVKSAGGKVVGAASKGVDAAKGMGSKAATIGKGLLKGAKFLPGIGLAVTGIMGVFDGVSAGFKEYNEGGDAGDIAREATAGVISGLTFGLVSQKWISESFTTIGDKFKTGFDTIKKDTLAGVEKIKEGVGKGVDKVKEMGDSLSMKFLGTDMKGALDLAKSKLGDFWDGAKDKFKRLSDSLPSMEQIGGKISSWFGFGEDDDKDPKAFAVKLTAQIEELKTINEKMKNRITALETAALDKAAAGTAGGGTIAIDAKSDRSVKSSSATTGGVTIGNPDQITAKAMG